MTDLEEEDGNVDGPPVTAPDHYVVSMRGFADQDYAKQLGSWVAGYIRAISREIDLSRLDGVTVAFDFDQALLDLDRGYPTKHQLKRTTGHVDGIAMSPGVLRDGLHKTHIVLNANYATALDKPDHELFQLALHVLAHECGHVEVASVFDRQFPGLLLRRQYPSVVDAIRWDVILGCWDEYAVSTLSAGFGDDPLPGYQESLIGYLPLARSNANEVIKAYRIHGDVDRLLSDLSGAYGLLMKLAAYFAGTLNGQGKDLSDCPEAARALKGHWFEPFYDRLGETLRQLSDRWGRWEREDEFAPIADIFEDVLKESGVYITRISESQAYVNVPRTAESMPLLFRGLGLGP